MLPIIRISRLSALSPEGVAAYITGHLEKSPELGPLRCHPALISPAGAAIPWIGNPDLWAEVGGDPKADHADPALIRQLVQGRDLEGAKLTASRTSWRPPCERVVSLPVEVSEALVLLGPEAIIHVGRALQGEALRQAEAAAVRIRADGGNLVWQPAKLLSLSYIHGTNALGEPQICLHDLVFGPARSSDGRWLTFDTGAMLRSNTENRRALGGVLVRSCAEVGLDVRIDLRLAREGGRTARGATVFFGDGQAIAPGQAPRLRRGEILAAQEIRAWTQGPIFTPKELQCLSKISQRPKPSLPPLSARLATKLESHGLGRSQVGTASELSKALLPALYATCFAQVQLEAFRGLPGDRSLAAEMVAGYGRSLAVCLGASHEHALAHARETWPHMLRDGLRELGGQHRNGESLAHACIPFQAQRLLLRHLRDAGLVSFGGRHGEESRPQLTPVGRNRMGTLVSHGLPVVPGYRPCLYPSDCPEPGAGPPCADDPAARPTNEGGPGLQPTQSPAIRPGKPGGSGSPRYRPSPVVAARGSVPRLPGQASAFSGHAGGATSGRESDRICRILGAIRPPFQAWSEVWAAECGRHHRHPFFAIDPCSLLSQRPGGPGLAGLGSVPQHGPKGNPVGHRLRADRSAPPAPRTAPRVHAAQRASNLSASGRGQSNKIAQRGLPVRGPLDGCGTPRWIRPDPGRGLTPKLYATIRLEILDGVYRRGVPQSASTCAAAAKDSPEAPAVAKSRNDRFSGIAMSQYAVTNSTWVSHYGEVIGTQHQAAEQGVRWGDRGGPPVSAPAPSKSSTPPVPSYRLPRR